MGKIIPVLLACLFVGATGLAASELEEQSKTVSLRVAASRQLVRVIQTKQTQQRIWRVQESGSQDTQPEPGWIGRHPILFGALVGASAGALVVAVTPTRCSTFCPDVKGEAAVVLGAAGAGVGALIAWAVVAD